MDFEVMEYYEGLRDDLLFTYEVRVIQSADDCNFNYGQFVQKNEYGSHDRIYTPGIHSISRTTQELHDLMSREMEFVCYQYREDLYSYISDVSKEAQGFRARFDWPRMTTNELEEQAALYQRLAAEEAKAEAARAEAAVNEFKALLDNVMKLGAADEKTALRWLASSETFYHFQDVEQWVYEQGVLFTAYGRDLTKRLERLVSYEPWDAAA